MKTSFYNRRLWITSPVFNLGDMIDGSEKMAVGVKSHMNRDVGLAWLDLPPIAPPAKWEGEEMSVSLLNKQTIVRRGKRLHNPQTQR